MDATQAQLTWVIDRLNVLIEQMADIRIQMARNEETAKQGDPVARREIAKIRDRLTKLENAPRKQLQVSAAAVALWIKLALIAGLLLANLPLGQVAGVAGAIF